MKRFLLILFGIFLFACSNSSKVGIPDNVLPKEKMADVLVDVHLMEAAMNINASSTDKFNSSLKIDVYKKHKITKQQYENSFEFYTQNPELLGEVYQLVLSNLSRMQAEAINKK
jgi:hypothetical protein